MNAIEEIQTAQPTPIAKIVKELLAHAEHFARLRANAKIMEESAWAEIRSWHEPDPVEIDTGFADPTEVRKMVEEICRAYGMKNVAETLLTWLYLKHRQLFLTHPGIVFRRDDRMQLSTPCYDEGFSEILAYTYCGCAGPVGDIVDFQALNPALITFEEGFPKDIYWRFLDLDWEIPLGMASYDMAIRPVDRTLTEILEQHSSPVAPLPVLENLATWARKIEAQPHCRFNHIALVVHARLLQGGWMTKLIW